MYFCPGAGHAPHHVWPEWVDKYKGKFDMGYEHYREVVLTRMKQMGIVPQETELTPMNPLAHRQVPMESRSTWRDGTPVGFTLGRREEALLPDG